jgi:hypothetical protein
MEIGHADKRGAPEFEIDGHRVTPGVRPSRTCRFLSEVRVELLADLHHVQGRDIADVGGPRAAEVVIALQASAIKSIRSLDDRRWLWLAGTAASHHGSHVRVPSAGALTCDRFGRE